MRTINFRHSVEQTRFVLFPVEAPNVILFQQLSVLTTVLQSMDIEWDVAYYHYDHAVLQGRCVTMGVCTIDTTTGTHILLIFICEQPHRLGLFISIYYQTLIG